MLGYSNHILLRARVVLVYGVSVASCVAPRAMFCSFLLHLAFLCIYLRILA